jgi:hypothetical protein
MGIRLLQPPQRLPTPPNTSENIGLVNPALTFIPLLYNNASSLENI